jgi:hypothetical protein
VRYRPPTSGIGILHEFNKGVTIFAMKAILYKRGKREEVRRHRVEQSASLFLQRRAMTEFLKGFMQDVPRGG